MEWQDYVEDRPDVMMGKAVLKETRITVEHVLEELGRGVTEMQLLASHPRLKPEHVRAACLYAAAVIGSEQGVV